MRYIFSIILIVILYSSLVSAVQICQYASSASAASENSLGSLAQYAAGPPNAPNNFQCTDWSGYGYSWSPSNWNVKANLTLKYSTPVYASNLTIFGDYDICFSKILLKNSQTNQLKEISNTIQNSCTLTQKLDSTFLADTVILETCGYSWSSTDSVQLCGDTTQLPPPPITPDITAPVYLIPYIGDIDGAVSSSWFQFYVQLASFFNQNKIEADFSFYPGTMNSHQSYKDALKIMYESPYIELVQKGNNGNQTEWEMDKLSLETQKSIISQGQSAFRSWMLNNLNIANVNLPISYNHIGAKFTQTTLKAAQELGFKIYFDLYVGNDLTPVNSTEEFDTYQYGVSFTTTGGAGNNLPFKSTKEIFDEINNLAKTGRSDLQVIYINNTPAMPFWVHQQDFESSLVPGAIDQDKWNAYTSTINLLKQDSQVKFITSKEAYSLRHQIQMPQSNLSKLCQYASSASAASENSLGSLAQYAAGPPNAPNNFQCTDWSGYGYSWSPSNWNVKANLTLKYSTPVYASNLTIFGDYDICFSKILLKNSQTNQLKEISNTIQNSCTLTQKLDSTFLADTVILETCGYSWSSTDSVQLCGQSSQTNISDPVPTNIQICPWKDCKKGAVSFSIDDGQTSCMAELEAKGFRGTYFLSSTGTYSSALWAKFEEAFKKGHELATHTRSHWCVPISRTQYIQEIDSNILDIKSHTSATEQDLITHAYPCGFTNQEIKDILKDTFLWNFLSARGYHINNFEDQSPQDYFNLRSFNTPLFHDPPLAPPNYLDVINQLEVNGKWANLVLHNECTDQGAINVLPSKNIWVDTIGNVVKYSYLRDNAKISSITQDSTQMKFTVSTQPQFNSQIYNQNLSLQISLPAGKTAASVTSNSQNIPFKQSQNILIITVPFPISRDIVINMQ